MPLAPKPSAAPRVRLALKLYRVTSIITGSFLLLLCLMMVLRYGFGVDIEFAGPFGVLYLDPRETIAARGGINLSTWILIAHGWFYVLYVASDFNLWSPMRWGPLRLLIMFLGGIIPLLSFILERRIHREVVAWLDSIDTKEKVTA
jgi:integral membrane protein